MWPDITGTTSPFYYCCYYSLPSGGRGGGRTKFRDSQRSAPIIVGRCCPAAEDWRSRFSRSLPHASVTLLQFFDNIDVTKPGKRHRVLFSPGTQRFRLSTPISFTVVIHRHLSVYVDIRTVWSIRFKDETQSPANDGFFAPGQFYDIFFFFFLENRLRFVVFRAGFPGLVFYCHGGLYDTED